VALRVYTIFGSILGVGDALGAAASLALSKAVETYTLSAQLSISNSSLPSGEVNVSYATNLSASGGISPYNWSILGGSLPPGLALSTSGVISGTPSTAGTYNFTVQVADSSSPQMAASKPLSIIVGS